MCEQQVWILHIQNQSDNLQKMVKIKQTDTEYTHMCNIKTWILYIQINSITLRVPRIQNRVSEIAMRLLNKAQDAQNDYLQWNRSIKNKSLTRAATKLF